MALTKGLPGGPESQELATSDTSTCKRLAARKTMSLASRGAASASIQIFSGISLLEVERADAVAVAVGEGASGRREDQFPRYWT